MVEQEVITLAAQFVQLHIDFERVNPRLVLDSTWPSCGMVELSLRGLMNRPAGSHSPQQRHIISAASCYLAGFVYESWKTFLPEHSLTLTLNEGSSEPHAVLRAEPSKLAPEPGISLNVTHALLEVLQSQREAERGFYTFAGPLHPNNYRLPRFLLGVCTGLSPWVSGPWNSQPIENWAAPVSLVSGMLNQSSSEYFSKLAPIDSDIFVPPFFDRLILPPAGFEESLPYFRSCFALRETLDALELEPDQTRRLLGALALSPDEQLSLTAAAVGFALYSEGDEDFFIEQLQSKGRTALALRPAIMALRKERQQKGEPIPESFHEALKLGNVPVARVLLSRERSAGLLPLVRLHPQLLVVPEFIPLIEVLAWYQLTPAIELTDRLLAANHPGRGFLLLLRAYLALVAESPDAAERFLTALPADGVRGTPLGADYFEVSALIAEANKDLSKAAQLWQQCFAETPRDETHDQEIHEHYVKALIALGRQEEAFFHLGALRKRSKLSFPLEVRYQQLSVAQPEVENRLDDIMTFARHCPLTPQTYSLCNALRYLLPPVPSAAPPPAARNADTAADAPPEDGKDSAKS